MPEPKPLSAFTFGSNRRKVRMPDVRSVARPAVYVAAIVLLAGSACVPPVAFHDGLPAWTPKAGKVEWRVGYQHLSGFGADSFDFLGLRPANPDFSVGYLTPGM